MLKRDSQLPSSLYLRFNLRKMFMSDEWTNSKWAKEEQGKRLARFMMMPFFLNCVVYALKKTGPLISILRLVDTEKKPLMGYIYEAMDREKESIASSFGGRKKNMRTFLYH